MPSLLYEFALTPDVFDPSVIEGTPELRVVLEQMLRGLCDNGVVANLDKGRWQRDVLRRIESLPKKQGLQGHKDRLMRLLSTLQDRRRLVRHPKRAEGPPSSLSE